jgi:aspartyl-tRNA(Asn)/glutamyl-tRNA(Gln) amidotransferase subunit B
VSGRRVEAVRMAMPELPDARRRRFAGQHGLPDYDARYLTEARATADYFEQAVAAGGAPKMVSNWMMGELARALNESGRDINDSPVTAPRLAGLVQLIDRGIISGAMAKGVFEKMFASGGDAEAIVTSEGLAQIDDESQIVEQIASVLSRNADAVLQFRGGKTSTFGFLVGQVMKAMNGKANPKRVNELLKRALAAEL